MPFKLREKNTSTIETELVSEEIPQTWAALASQLDVDPCIISNTARSILANQGSPVPSKLPGPRVLGAKFVTLIVNNITKSGESRITRPDRVGPVLTSDRSKLVRDAIDEAVEVLGVGNGVIEYVADKLGLHIRAVQKVFKERHDALIYERTVADQERQREFKIAQGKHAAEVARMQSQADRQEASKPHRPMHVPPVQVAPPKRPEAMPESHEDIELDSFLRAAWIAAKAGIPRAQEDAVKTLVGRFKVSPEEALEAIENSYTARSAAGKTQMERRAARLAKEKGVK